MQDATRGEAMEQFDDYSGSIKQHWPITRPGLRRKRWEEVWEVLQKLSLIVRELRPDGWDSFGDYVCG